MKYHFIKTADPETRKKLIAEGFKLISQNGNVATFLNDCTLTFEKTNKIQYSNMLTF